MAFSYKPLWKLLIDRDMTKKQLMYVTGISKSTMDKMVAKKDRKREYTMREWHDINNKGDLF